MPHCMCSQVMHVDWVGQRARPTVRARKEAAKWYLRGYKEIPELIPEKDDRRPSSGLFDTGDEKQDAMLQEQLRKKFRGWEARRILRMHAEVLKNQTLSLYEKRPGERGNLATVCSEVINDDEFCRKLVAALPQAGNA